MKFKELFDKEFLYESKKEDKKATKIFYNFDINIKKKEEEQSTSEIPQTEPTPEVSAQPAPVAPDMSAQPVPAPEMNAGTPMAPEMNTGVPDLSNLPLASVVTEDDDDHGDNDGNVSVNDDNNIVRKFKGEMLLEKEEIDNIQTIEDIINKLAENKVDGVNVLDEFTSDILQVMANPATQMQLKEKIDVESKIFAEILYGKKPEDSVGVRFVKRKGSEMITTSMMIDNKIVNAQYKKETLDKRITDYRNDEFEEK
jgi:hypothetical protein